MSCSILKQMAKVDKRGVRRVGLAEVILCQRVGGTRGKTRAGHIGKEYDGLTFYLVPHGV